MVKASVGLYIPELIEILDSKRPFTIMSGHDTTLAPFLSLLTNGIQMTHY